MSQLEPPTQERSEDAESGPIELSLSEGRATIEIPDDATPAEAAAVAAAIGTHIADRRRAAAAAAAAADDTPAVDQWVVADRMRARGKRHWPRRVDRGDEWCAAARSF